MTPRMTKNAGESLRAAGALSTVGLSFVFAIGIGPLAIGELFDGMLPSSV